MFVRFPSFAKGNEIPKAINVKGNENPKEIDIEGEDKDA
jgi:hypothetical protein